MSADDDDLDFGFDASTYVEEERDVLERLAELRRAAEAKEFPQHLLTSDPLEVRRVIQRSKAETSKANTKDYSWGPPEVLAHLVPTDQWPGSAKTLLKKLSSAWKVTGWMMRGPVISSQNRERTVKTCFALKADHPDGRKVRVTYYAKADGKWDRDAGWMWVAEANVPWQKAPSVKALVEYVSDDDVVAQVIPLEG